MHKYIHNYKILVFLHPLTKTKNPIKPIKHFKPFKPFIPSTMQIRQVTEYLNSRFLPFYQESYDNSGFLIGDPAAELKGILITLDVTPDAVDEAISGGFNLIVSHHPLIFNGLKRITTESETGRMISLLLQNQIAVYAAHTNLDNLDWGVNGILANKLGLNDCRILRPTGGALRKLVTYVPTEHAETLRQALFAAGAGGIGQYDECSYNSDGYGTFRAGQNATPYCGEVGKLHCEPETRIEVIYEKRIERKLIQRLIDNHPYEEPAYDCLPLDNSFVKIGAGMVGNLSSPLPISDFLETVKATLGLPVIRTSQFNHNSKSTIKTVAICGGSGSFLIGDAKSAGADIYMTGDLKYHDFQQSEGKIILADIGHYESEQFAKELIYSVISEKFSTFACQISKQAGSLIQYN